MSTIKTGTNGSCPGYPEDTLENDPAIFHRESHVKKLPISTQDVQGPGSWSAMPLGFLRLNELSPPNTFSPLENSPSNI